MVFAMGETFVVLLLVTVIISVIEVSVRVTSVIVPVAVTLWLAGGAWSM